MARRRWATVEIKVIQHVDDVTFTSVRSMDIPHQHGDIGQPSSLRLTKMFVEAFLIAEKSANNAWRRLEKKTR
jgi:hypothetical protein